MGLKNKTATVYDTGGGGGISWFELTTYTLNGLKSTETGTGNRRQAGVEEYRTDNAYC